jgi:uncharacterized membrane protein
MDPGPLQRLAIGSTAAILGVLVLWKGPAAASAGPAGLALLLVVALPLGWVLAGLAGGRVRAGRIASLLLPFYAAGFLTEAVADPSARLWATVGAFATALAFASVIAWVRRPPAR